MSDKDYLWLNLRELPYFRAMLRAVEAHFYQEFELPSPVLDVGCGDGHFAAVTFNHPLDVGLDPETVSLKEAARRNAYRLLVQADGGRTPFPDAFFGSAVSNSVLEHIPQIELVLAEVARILQPGAPFLFCVPNPGYLSELSIRNFLMRIDLHQLGSAYTSWFRRMSRVHHLEPPEVWQAWLEKAGFCLEKWWHYFPPSSMRVLEWGHYFGLPSLVAHILFGRWILIPTRWNLSLTERLVRPFAEAVPHANGTFTFFVARQARV
jgi:SAM-dependent methyltransferase